MVSKNDHFSRLTAAWLILVALTLVSLGLSEWFREVRWLPLNETGLRQAEQIAKRLAKETIHAIYTSDLSRAANTTSCPARASIPP